MSDELKKAEQILSAVLDRYTNIEKALILAENLRQECGGDWVIDMEANGCFRIERLRRDMQ